jgi:hypothetical protein
MAEIAHSNVGFNLFFFQGLQLLACENSMQSTNNIKMTKLQMRFQVMIAMNVPFIVH